MEVIFVCRADALTLTAQAFVSSPATSIERGAG